MVIATRARFMSIAVASTPSAFTTRAPEHAPPGDAAMEDMTKAAAEELTDMV